MVLTCPNYRKKVPQFLGGGHYREGKEHEVKLTTECFYKKYCWVIKSILQTEVAPMQWHLSDAFTLGKEGKVGGKAWRWLHLLEVFGTRFYAAMMLDPECPKEFHGFVKQKGRTEAIIIQSCVQWRWKRSGISGLRCLEDIAGAFPAIAKDTLETVTPKLVEFEHTSLANQRHDYACFMVRTFDGEFCALPRQGVLAGDPFAVRSFREGFTKPIACWDKQLNTKAANRLMMVRSPNGTRVDGSKTIFADDIGKFVIVARDGRKHETPLQEVCFRSIPTATSGKQFLRLVEERYEENETTLSAELALHELFMNKDKQICQPLLNGKFSTTVKKHLSKHGLEYSEHNTIREVARYLGPLLNIEGNNKSEIAARRKALSQATMRYYSVFSPDISIATRRVLFSSYLVSRVLSATEAFCWTKTEEAIFDKCIAAAGRQCMRGAAYKAVTLVDVDGAVAYERKESLTNAQVMKHWKLVSFAEEARARRVRMYQRWAAVPDLHAQVLAVVFGQFVWENGPTQKKGVVMKAANPWAQQFKSDMDFCYRRVEDFHGIAIDLQFRYVNLFHLDFSETAEKFCSLDIAKAIRASSDLRAVAIPPPRDPGADLDIDAEVAMEQIERPFVCDIVLTNGQVCGSRWSTGESLQKHAVFEHGLVHFTRSLVVTNQCPWCSSILKTKYIAQRHVQNAMKTTRCSLDRNHFEAQVIEPKSLQCRYCAFEGEDLPSLQRHLRRHSIFQPKYLVCFNNDIKQTKLIRSPRLDGLRRRVKARRKFAALVHDSGDKSGEEGQGRHRREGRGHRHGQVFENSGQVGDNQPRRGRLARENYGAASGVSGERSGSTRASVSRVASEQQHERLEAQSESHSGQATPQSIRGLSGTGEDSGGGTQL